MKDYDGPAYKQTKGDDSIKQRRFNRLSQSDSAKSQFQPALKNTRSLETNYEFDASYPAEEQRPLRNSSGPDNSTSKETSPFSKQLEKRSVSFDQQNQRPTPPESYQVPFLKQHSTQRHSLNQASMEGTMAERQTHPSKPKRQVPAYQPTSAKQERYSNESQLSETDEETRLNSTQPVQSQVTIDEKTKFQPTYLPKSTQVEDTSKKNSVAERELARRLVKTKDMFLLFDH